MPFFDLDDYALRYALCAMRGLKAQTCTIFASLLVTLRMKNGDEG
jgi:hypothetical protein